MAPVFFSSQMTPALLGKPPSVVPKRLPPASIVMAPVGFEPLTELNRRPVYGRRAGAAHGTGTCRSATSSIMSGRSTQ